MCSCACPMQLISQFFMSTVCSMGLYVWEHLGVRPGWPVARLQLRQNGASQLDQHTHTHTSLILRLGAVRTAVSMGARQHTAFEDRMCRIPLGALTVRPPGGSGRLETSATHCLNALGVHTHVSLPALSGKLALGHNGMSLVSQLLRHSEQLA